jgi:hypothetical protein
LEHKIPNHLVTQEKAILLFQPSTAPSLTASPGTLIRALNDFQRQYTIRMRSASMSTLNEERIHSPIMPMIRATLQMRGSL